MTIFSTALIPRLALVVFWQITNPDGVFPDEISYLAEARDIARETTVPMDSQFWISNWAFFRPLVAIAEITDHHAFVGRFSMAIAGSLIAVVVFLMGRHISVRVGLLAGLIMALYPSQIFWSSMYLKDTLSALLLAGMCLIFISAARKPSLRRLLIGFLSLSGLLALSTGVRLFSALTATLAVLLSCAWLIVQKCSPKQLALGLLLLLVTTGGTLMFLGDRIPLGGTGNNQELREREYEDAKTLISCRPIPFLPGPEPYESGWWNDFACAPFSARMVLIDPLPNQLGKSTSLVPPFVEHLLWWPLLIAAALSLKRSAFIRRKLVLPSLLTIGLVLQWSLIDRVFGTTYRHRTEFVWAVVLLAAPTISQLLAGRPKQTIESLEVMP